MVTEILQKECRETDFIARIGGEEFAIFLSDTAIDDAFQLADKIRNIIANSTLNIDGKVVNYTVSLGVDSSQPADQSIDVLFKRADLKLYGAKDKGRNRVEM